MYAGGNRGPMIEIRNPSRPHQVGAARELIRVVIVQYRRLLGEALQALVNSEPDMTVVGLLDCDIATGGLAASLQPDVLIVDFYGSLPMATNVASQARRHGCEAGLIVLARRHAKGAIRSAVEAGASALITEFDDAAAVLNAVRKTAEGAVLIGPDQIAQVLGSRRQWEPPRRRLTRREGEILSFLAEGASNRQIASSLGISYMTVRTHVRNLTVKLAAQSKVEVVARAYQLDMVGQDSPFLTPAGSSAWPALAETRTVGFTPNR